MHGRDGLVASRDEASDVCGARALVRAPAPNFYFHATTAYDILRMRGKRDFLGRP